MKQNCRYRLPPNLFGISLIPSINQPTCLLLCSIRIRLRIMIIQLLTVSVSSVVLYTVRIILIALSLKMGLTPGSIADIDISISDVFKKLSTLDTNKGPGMYGILPWYSLKRVALFITASLAYFQPVIEEREFSVALENYVNCFQIRRRI